MYGVDENISYFHEPFSFRERLAKAAVLVDTPYVAMLADDDLYFKAGLDECVSFWISMMISPPFLDEH